jgi:hypothetical protein
MAGNKEGLQALIKRSASEAMWTHSMVHRESLAMKELCPELSEVMDTVTKTLNCMKMRPLCRVLIREVNAVTELRAVQAQLRVSLSWRIESRRIFDSEVPE